MRWLGNRGSARRARDDVAGRIDAAAALSPEADGAGPSHAGRYGAALAEARRGFDEQADQFGRIRTAAGSFLGYGGVAFSVLVASGTPVGSSGPCLLLAAVVLFSVLAGVAAWLMLPVKRVPGVDAARVVGWADDGETPDGIDRDLALHLAKAYEDSTPKLSVRNRALVACTVLFAVTVILLVARLIGA